MEGNEVNFDEVRKKDCMVKRKTPLWSGQDVLDIGLTPTQATWVTSKLNLMRVWPKGLTGLLKRARVLLKDIVKSGFWDNFMTGCVLLNTITMAMERYDMPEAEVILLT